MSLGWSYMAVTSRNRPAPLWLNKLMQCSEQVNWPLTCVECAAMSIMYFILFFFSSHYGTSFYIKFYTMYHDNAMIQLNRIQRRNHLRSNVFLWHGLRWRSFPDTGLHFPVTPSHWPCFPKATSYFQFRYALDTVSLVLRTLLLRADPAFEPLGLGVSPGRAFGETHRSVGSAPVSSSFSRWHVLFLSVALTSPSRTTAQNMDPVMTTYTIGVDRDELSSSSDVTLVACTTVYVIGEAVWDASISTTVSVSVITSCGIIYTNVC